MPHRSSRTTRARLFAVIALFALAATYLTPLVNADWAAWRYDHGHLSLAPVAGQHTHPWDRSTAEGTTAEGDSVLVFTTSGESTPGITAIERPAHVEVSVAIHTVAFERAPLVPPLAEASAPAPQPPRSVPSHA